MLEGEAERIISKAIDLAPEDDRPQSVSDWSGCFGLASAGRNDSICLRSRR